MHRVDGGDTRPTSWKILWGTSPFIGIKPLKWDQILLCYCCSLIVHNFFSRSVSHITLYQLKGKTLMLDSQGKDSPVTMLVFFFLFVFIMHLAWLICSGWLHNILLWNRDEYSFSKETFLLGKYLLERYLAFNSFYLSCHTLAKFPRDYAFWYIFKLTVQNFYKTKWFPVLFGSFSRCFKFFIFLYLNSYTLPPHHLPLAIKPLDSLEDDGTYCSIASDCGYFCLLQITTCYIPFVSESR